MESCGFWNGGFSHRNSQDYSSKLSQPLQDQQTLYYATNMLHNNIVFESTDETSVLFRALADPTRLRIIDELMVRDRQSLFEIYTRVVLRHGIGQTRQAFSRHLSVLEDVGILRTEWQGTTKLHSINIEPLTRLRGAWLSKFGEPT
jgi:DNA-binding transcriptional ArsR family regulator